MEVTGELAVENPRADLEEQPGAAGSSPSAALTMRLLITCLTADSVNAVDRLASTAAFAVVGDAPGVGADVAVELADRFGQLGLPGAGRQGIPGRGGVL